MRTLGSVPLCVISGDANSGPHLHGKCFTHQAISPDLKGLLTPILQSFPTSKSYHECQGEKVEERQLLGKVSEVSEGLDLKAYGVRTLNAPLPRYQPPDLQLQCKTIT